MKTTSTRPGHRRRKRRPAGPSTVIALFLLLIAALAYRYEGDLGQFLPHARQRTAVKPSPEAWSGQVVGVTDGDTIKVYAQNGPQAGQMVKIRLYGLDAPEKKQPFGQRSRDHLAGLARGPIRVQPVERDRYGRTVAVIHDQAGRNLNQAQIAAGMAWVYTSYCKAPVCGEWRAAEAAAKAAQLGLWADKAPIPPWEWRQSQRPRAPSPAGAENSGAF